MQAVKISHVQQARFWTAEKALGRYPGRPRQAGVATCGVGKRVCKGVCAELCSHAGRFPLECVD
eukprot:3308578-Amphidinium_carterae.1